VTPTGKIGVKQERGAMQGLRLHAGLDEDQALRSRAAHSRRDVSAARVSLLDDESVVTSACFNKYGASCSEELQGA